GATYIFMRHRYGRQINEMQSAIEELRAERQISFDFESAADAMKRYRQATQGHPAEEILEEREVSDAEIVERVEHEPGFAEELAAAAVDVVEIDGVVVTPDVSEDGDDEERLINIFRNQDPNWDWEVELRMREGQDIYPIHREEF